MVIDKVKARQIIARLAQAGINVLYHDEKLTTKSAPGAFTPELINLIKQNKPLLVDYLSQSTVSAVSSPQVTATARGTGPLALSFAQHRMWFISRLDVDSTQYNMPMAFDVTGDFNVVAAQAAINGIVQRHEVLRTVYGESEQGAWQSVQPTVDFVLQQSDLSALPEAQKQTQLRAWLKADAQQPFDISCDLMIRAGYLVLRRGAGGDGQNGQAQQGVLLLNMHHIAADGWSMEVLLREFVSLYRAITAGQQNPLPPLDIQYADYALWQRDWLKDEVLQSQLDYWKKQLANISAVHNLMLSHPRPQVKKHIGKRVMAKLDAGVAASLQQLAKNQQLTPFMLCHGALALVLARFGTSSDIVIGTPVANRAQVALEPLIGCFVNTLVLRVDTDYDQLDDYFAHVRQVNLDAQSHQDLPFEQLVEHLNVMRSSAHTPLFQIMLNTNTDFALQDSSVDKGLSLPGLKLSAMAADNVAAKFDLDVNVVIAGNGVNLTWTYDCSIFDEATITGFSDHLCAILGGLAQMRHSSVATLPLQSDQALAHQLKTLNETDGPLPSDDCIHHLFEAAVARWPQRTAVIVGTEKLSYQQLNEKSNQLAHYLIAQGVKPDTLVGLCVERSFDMMIGLLAIIKSGGAYVPLDSNLPQARLAYMMADSGAALIVAQPGLLDLLQCTSQQLVSMQDPVLASQPIINPDSQALGLNNHHLAYVIYTSGSTGQPKGVMLEHHSVVNRLDWGQRQYPLTHDDKVLQKTPYSFDVSVWELFWAIGCGAQLVMAKPEGHKDPQYLLEVIKAQGITRLHYVPSMLNLMLDSVDWAQCTSVQQVFCSGEILPTSVVSAFFATGTQAQLHNLYGPTETAIEMSYFDCARYEEVNSVPIGRVIQNVTVYVLDSQLNVQPMGAPGELHIGGSAVARGYLNKPDLTAQMFIANPFVKDPTERLYKSGDLVRWLPCGELEYLGRIDDQVKIRGQRMELGEIENQLLQLDGVDQGAVVCSEDNNGDKRLVGYVVLSQPLVADDEHSISDLKRAQVLGYIEALNTQLPAYMVPGIFVFLHELPLTPNGKVDRKALPQPNEADLHKQDYVAPRNDTEQKLCAIWQQVLGVPKISIKDDFFALGGHSLLVTKVISLVRERLDLEVPIRCLFEQPTVAGFALLLPQYQTATMLDAIKAVQRSGPLRLSFAQQRMWFISQLDSDSAQYNMPMAFDVIGDFNVAAAQAAINSIVQRHEILRTVYGEDAQGSWQSVTPSVDFELSPIDLSALPEAQQQTQLRAWLKADAQKPVDISNDLMLRASYLLLGCVERVDEQPSQQHGVLSLNMHHIASDGWSIEVLLGEFVSLYRAITADQKNPLQPLDIQYADYAQWQRDWLQGEVLQLQLDYWKKQLANASAVHNLMLDHPRPLIKQHIGQRITAKLDADVAASLQQLAKNQQLTPFMLFHGALALVLARFGTSGDIVIGTPVANRAQMALEPLIGCFVNTLVLRVDTDHDQLDDYFAHVRQVNLDAQSHQDLPFEQLVEHLNVSRSSAHTPLFQIMLNTNTDFAVQDPSASEGLSLPGLKLSAIAADSVPAKFDLDVNVVISDSGINLSWIYDCSIFDEATITGFSDHLCAILGGLAQMRHSSVATLPLQSDQALAHQLDTLNEADGPAPSDDCIHHLFEATVARWPQRTAVIVGTQQLSYQQLNEKSNQLAHYLIAQGVTPDTLVGLCVERSFDMMIGLLAIIKSGGAYVPLDPNLPQARLAYMMADSGATLIVAQQGLLDGLQCTSQKLVSMQDPVWQDYSSVNPDSQALGLNNRHLAYVIYTSGSTGQPKGVMLEHRSVVNRLDWGQRQYPLSHDDKVLQKTPYSFDVSVWELFWAIGCGAQLVMAKPEGHKDPQYLMDVIQGQGITRVHYVPSMLNLMLDSVDWAQCTSVQQVFCSGEALPTSLVSAFFATGTQAQLHNLYGPTEAAIEVSYFDCGQYRSLCCVPMGRPIQNVGLYVLDSQLNVQPMGAPGELHIGGVAVARGYLNNPDLTAQMFIANPFVKDPSERLYKSGDLVRWLPCGELEYLGRIDSQVKIRGQRMELGEIENQLLQLDGVDQGAVVCSEDNNGDKRLVGYVVLSQPLVADDEHSISDLKRAQVLGYIEALNTQLPAYMVPGIFVFLHELPLTPNGKVDRKALPQPNEADLHKQDYVAPRNDTEQQLCVIWQQVLGVEKVSIEDDFFALGGHSLLVTKVINLVRERLRLEVPIRCLFEQPSVAGFALLLPQYQTATVLDAIKPVERGTDMPLSYAQMRLWIIEQLGQGSAEYNMPSAFQLKGTLNTGAFEQAVHTIIERHQVLRSRFEGIDGQARQHVDDDFGFTLIVTDLTGLGAAQQEQQCRQLAQQDANHPFDLSKDLLLRVQLFKLADDQHLVLFNLHHIASDGWSMGIMIREFSTLYGAFCDNQSDPLPALAVQYADYAAWQFDWLQGETLAQLLSYWELKLKDIPPIHSLPLNKSRPARQTFAGASHFQAIEAEFSQDLQTLCQTQGVTLFMLLHSAFALLLNRYSGESDIVIGTPIAGRAHQDVESLIGFFVNTLVLRSDLSQNDDFETYLAQSKQTVLDAFTHQHMPFDMLVETLNPQRSLAHNPVVQILFTLQNNEQVELSLPGLTVQPMTRSQTSQIKFDLELTVVEDQTGLMLNWDYNTDLFAPDFIQRMATNFNVLLHSIVAEPGQSIATLNLLDEPEQQTLTSQWITEQVPVSECIGQRFEQQVSQHPDAIALLDNQTQLSYRALNDAANQMARHLIAQGFEPNGVAAILMHRSIDMVVTILAIIKAGGAYLPIDITLPKSRIHYMLEQAQASLVVGQRQYGDMLEQSSLPMVWVDDALLNDQLAACSVDNVIAGDRALNPDSLAYVMFTSGSTGKPKGVMINHRNVLSYVEALRSRYHIDDKDTMLQFSSPSFDIFVEELFTTLLSGARLVLRNEDVLDGAQLFWQFIAEHSVSVVSLPTTFWHLLANKLPLLSLPKNQLRLVVVGGEAMSAGMLKTWRDNIGDDVTVYNTYGPTECTVIATAYDTRDYDFNHGSVPIGTATAHVQCYVLDQHQQLCPQGVAGELYIGGNGVAQGYINNPTLTVERFISNPFAEHTAQANAQQNAKLFRTGDRVRYLANGELEFLERCDHQVKIRGYRVELEEIENLLAADEQVSQAVVRPLSALSDGVTQEALVAFVVARQSSEDAAVLRDRLQQQLSQSLPYYMIPSAIEVIGTLPTTVGGKVDVKALPPVDLSAIRQSSYVAPRTEIEQKLVDIYQQVLSVVQVGIDDLLFDLGANSRLLVVIKHHMNQNKLDVGLRDIMEYQSVRRLASFIEDKKRNRDNEQHQAIVTLNQQVDGCPWYFIHPYGGGVEHYRALANALAQTSPVFGLSAPFIYGQSVELECLDQLAGLYADIIVQHSEQNSADNNNNNNNNNNNGRCRIGGFSFGGSLASLVAGELFKRGISVDCVVMFDSYHSNYDQQAQLSMFDRLCLVTDFIGIPRPDDNVAADWAGYDDEQMITQVVQWVMRHSDMAISDKDIRSFIEFHEQLERVGKRRSSLSADIPVQLFYDRKNLAGAENLANWQAFLSTEIETVAMDYDHQSFLSSAAVDEIMPRLTSWLKRQVE